MIFPNSVYHLLLLVQSCSGGSGNSLSRTVKRMLKNNGMVEIFINTRNIPAGQCGHRRYQRRQESFPILLRAAQLIPTLPSLLSSPRKWVSFLSVQQGFARPIYPRSRRGPRGGDAAGPRGCLVQLTAGFRKSGIECTHLIQTNM